MKTLVQLLIEAGITPRMFTPKVKWLAQDERDSYVFAFTSLPKRGSMELTYKNEDVSLADIGSSGNNYIDIAELACDWETPLSWEDFKTAYDKMVDDTWPKSFAEVKDPQAPAIQAFIDSANIEESADSLLARYQTNSLHIEKLKQVNKGILEECNKRLDKCALFIGEK